MKFGHGHGHGHVHEFFSKVKISDVHFVDEVYVVPLSMSNLMGMNLLSRDCASCRGIINHFDGLIRKG